MARLLSLPISARLALWYALTLLLLLSGFAVFCYLGFHAAAHRSFDRHLDHEWDAVAPLLRATGSGVDVSALERAASVATRLEGPNGTFVRVLTTEGDVVYQSANVEGLPPLGVVLPEGGDVLRVSREWAGEPVRSRVSPVQAPGGALAGYAEVSGDSQDSTELRFSPEPMLSGSSPRHASSSSEPRLPSVGPEMVPEASRSPVRRLQPPTVWCASCCAIDQ